MGVRPMLRPVLDGRLMHPSCYPSALVHVAQPPAAPSHRTATSLLCANFPLSLQVPLVAAAAGAKEEEAAEELLTLIIARSECRPSRGRELRAQVWGGGREEE